MSRILGGAKGRFCPVAGGGGVLCRFAVAVWACARCRSLQAKTGGRCPGLDHYRRTLQAKTTGPARPPIWPGSVGYIGDFQPCGIFGPVGPLFCPVAGFLRPCGDLSRLDLCGASGGLLWAVVGWVGIACGPAVSIWGGRRARCYSSAVAFDLCPASCLGLSSSLALGGLFRPFWGFICLWVVSCCGVLFLLLYRAKEKRPGLGRFSLGGVGVSPSIERWPAGLAWTRSRYAGRASPL